MSYIIDNVRMTGIACPLCGSTNTQASPSTDGGLRLVCRSCDKNGGTTYVVDDVMRASAPVLPALTAEEEAEVDIEIEIVRTDVPLVRLRGSSTVCAICESTPGLCALHAEGYEEPPPYTRSSAAKAARVARESREALEEAENGGESLGEARLEVRDAKPRGIGQR